MKIQIVLMSSLFLFSCHAAEDSSQPSGRSPSAPLSAPGVGERESTQDRDAKRVDESNAWDPVKNIEVATFEGESSGRISYRYPYENAAFSGNIVGSVRARAFESFPIAIQVGVDPEFSTNEQQIILKATQVFAARALKPNVIECAMNRANRELPKSRTQFEAELYNAISPIQINGVYLPAFLFVAKFWKDPVTVGLGYINLFYDTDQPLPEYSTRHYLHVGLNSDFLGDGSAYWAANHPEYWAGVIAHEILHNLGYSHPHGYEGTFIREYGNCVWQNGHVLEGEENLPEDREIRK